MRMKKMSRKNPRSDVNFRVEVLDNLISVTFTGTCFCVIYRKPTEQSAFGPTGFSIGTTFLALLSKMNLTTVYSD